MDLFKLILGDLSHFKELLERLNYVLYFFLSKSPIPNSTRIY